ncbi:MAG: DUF167 family protein [Chloroflexota bacterium]|nr:DUF167 family protein [Chloroflexota bacterium]
MKPLQVQEGREGVYFYVRLIPRAGKDTIVGLYDRALKVRLKAPPVEGKANASLVKFLARCLDVARSDVRIVGGYTSRRKRIFVAGLAGAELRRRLGLGKA